MESTVNIIGSGNVAHYLATAFHEKGVQVKSIYSRQAEKGKMLAQQVNAHFASSIQELDRNADIWFIPVSDDHIPEVAVALPEKAFVVHTSGMTPMHLLAHANAGVFYPLQTFHASYPAIPRPFPILIEATTEAGYQRLGQLVEALGLRSERMDSEHRKLIHLAAVLVNNFTNHLAVIASGLLKEHGVDFKLLTPLILESAERLAKSDPELLQTGPARRGDRLTLDRHLQLLADHPEYQDIYKAISESILRHYKDSN